jgi:hypothetical protein
MMIFVMTNFRLRSVQTTNMIAASGDIHMKHRLVLGGLAWVALTLSACGTNITNITQIQGSGMIISSDRAVSDFSSIQINLGADLALSQGGSESMTIQADDNLMQYLETRVENGRLIVSTPSNTSITPSQPIRLSVRFTTLTEIEILGSSISAAALDLDALAIRFSGSGSTRLSGRADEQTIQIRGQATINNFDLASRQVSVDISGNGVIEVSAADTLNIVVAGMGILRYNGSPTITQNISGTADIAQRQE